MIDRYKARLRGNQIKKKKSQQFYYKLVKDKWVNKFLRTINKSKSSFRIKEFRLRRKQYIMNAKDNKDRC